MREYEIVYLIADSVAEDKISVIIKKVEKFITGMDGKVLKEDNLGRRRLAYTVKKNEFATYIVLNIQLEGKKIRELENDLKLTPEVIRHLIVLKKAEKISILDEKIEAVDNEVIEEVIGERSFEQIEGETEESRDLMAKRETSLEEHQDAEKVTTKDEEVREIIEQEVEIQEETKAKVEKAKKAPREKKETVEDVAEAIAEKKVEAEKKESEETTEVKPKTKAKKVVKPKEDKPKTDGEDEAERLRKLDEKLDKILNEDI